MTDVGAESVKKLRDSTGAGVMDARKALLEAEGDTSKAKDILKARGEEKVAKKSERETSQGIIETYAHTGGKVGSMVYLACETDFVARNEDFKTLAHDIAMHITAAAPLYIAPADVPAGEIKKEKEIYQEQLKTEGKPADMLDKIIAGKVEKFYQEVCLLKQTFIKDDKVTIEKLIEEAIAKMGEKIEIINFSRFQI